MAKKIKIIEWETDTNSSDGTPCYRVDKKGEGERFFRDLLNNSEAIEAQDNAIRLVEVTEKEWNQIEKNGKELA